MRLTLGVLAGISITLAAVAIWPDFIGWVFTRIPPVTPVGHTPKYRTWVDGAMTEGTWT